MVSKATDYEYVVGATSTDTFDLSDFTPRMKFDGNILPKRQSNVVRGEDIAFLSEFAFQRIYAIESTYHRNKTEYVRTSYSTDYLGFIKEHLDGSDTLVMERQTAPSGVQPLGWPYALLTSTSSYPCFQFFDTIPTATTVSQSMYPHVVFPDSVKTTLPDTFYKYKYDFVTDFVAERAYLSRRPKLSYDRIKSYFDFAKTISKYMMYPQKRQSVLLNSVDGSAPALQRETIITSSGSKYWNYLSDWGMNEYSSTNSQWYSGYDYVYFPAGQPLYSIYAPHAKEAYALCRFKVSRDSTETVTTYMYRFIKMTPSSSAGTFTLMSDEFSGISSITTIMNESGLDFNTGMTGYSVNITKSCRILPLSVYPIVLFDDHTDFLSEESQS